jgi:hypothetical protein
MKMSENLSPAAQERLDELLSIPIEQAALSCLNEEVVASLPSNPTAKQIVNELVKNFGRGSDCYLFSEFSTKSDYEISQMAKNEMSEGFYLDEHNYLLQTPFDWLGPNEASRSHRYKIHAWYMLDSSLKYVSKSGNRDTFSYCKKIAIEWTEKFVFGSERDEFAWYDMSTAQRSTLLAYIIRWSLIQESQRNSISRFLKSMNPVEILTLIVSADVHIHELLSEDRLALHSNHGLFQMSGLLSLCSELPFLKQSTESRSMAIRNIEEMTENHFFEDGFHKEHSPLYHVYMANYLHQLQDAGWLHDSNSLSSLSTLSKEICNWYIMPDGYIAPIGDGKYEYPSNVYCMFDLNLDSDGTPASPSGLRVHPNGGVAIASHYDVDGRAFDHLIFNAQFHSRQHKHADDLSFHYCANRQQYLVDSGTFTYHYDDPERMYVESTRAHNAIEIDGLNYSRFKQDAFGSALSMIVKIGSCTIMEGKIEHTRLVPPEIPNNQVKTSDSIKLRNHSSEPGIHHRRLMIHVPEYFLVVIDLLCSKESHDYTQWFHLAPELNVNLESNGGMTVLDNLGQIHSTIHPIELDDSNPYEVLFVRGQKEPYLQGWFSRDGKVLLPNQAIGLKRCASSTSFATVFDHSGNASKKPTINIGTGGRYLRFSMKYPENKFDLIIREDQDGNRSIEFNDGREQIIQQVSSGLVWEGD